MPSMALLLGGATLRARTTAFLDMGPGKTTQPERTTSFSGTRLGLLTQPGATMFVWARMHVQTTQAAPPTFHSAFSEATSMWPAATTFTLITRALPRKATPS